MINPILNKQRYFLGYMLIWIMLAAIQIGFFYFFFHLKPVYALADAFIHNLIYGLSGLAIWFPIRFNPMGKQVLNPLITIIATGIIAVILWVSLPVFILKIIFTGHQDYLNFLNQSIFYRIISSIFLYVVLVLVYSLIVYNENLRQQLIRESGMKSLLREAELNMLKFQINPHFLFNALNSISLLTKKDPSKAREMIIKFSEFLRYSLRYNQKETTLLKSELDNMKRYLEIEKIRFGDRLRYELELESDEVLEWPIPNMILQPLFENAIKHGVYESSDPITIQMNIKKFDHLLYLELKNNYDPKAISPRGTGIGLKNITERLELMYGRMDLLESQKINGTFTVRMRIPDRIVY